VILAQVCRVWGQLLESKVGLLDAVQLTQDSTTNLDFRMLLAETTSAVTGGQPVGGPLLSSWLVPRTFSAAIATGEESGRLGDALLFVADCLDEDNAQILASLGRIIEPLLLSVMGLVVGTVAISLFMPLFDLATIAGAK
jgi:type II secretory pathway component PulF